MVKIVAAELDLLFDQQHFGLRLGCVIDWCRREPLASELISGRQSSGKVTSLWAQMAFISDFFIFKLEPQKDLYNIFPNVAVIFFKTCKQTSMC